MTVPGPESMPQTRTISGERRGLNIAIYELRKFHHDFYNGRTGIRPSDLLYKELNELAATTQTPAANMLINTIDNFSQHMDEEERWLRMGAVHTIASGLLEGTGNPQRVTEILSSPVTVERPGQSPQSVSVTEWLMTCDQADLQPENCGEVLAQTRHYTPLT